VGMLGRFWSRPRRALVGLVSVLLIPIPASAADKVQSSPPPLRSALADVRARGPAVPPAPLKTTRRAEQAPAGPATESRAFFKTPAGIVVLAALGAGVGYALYSAQHDRVSSPGKK